MLRTVNPIEYGDLDPEIRLRLDRYVRRLTTVKKQQWSVDQIYKPDRWYKAKLTSSDGSEVVVWYRVTESCWTVVKSCRGRGIFVRRPRDRWPLILKALENLGLVAKFEVTQ